jgi:hypothetical protein
MFDRVFSSLGWRNLFLDLPKLRTGTPSDGDVSDTGHLDLNIKFLKHPRNSSEQGLIMRPHTDQHHTFLSQWILNPGVKNSIGTGRFDGELTFRDDFDRRIISKDGHEEIVTRADFDRRTSKPGEQVEPLQADLVVISGHGLFGQVQGRALEDELHLGTGGATFKVAKLTKPIIAMPTTGRVKYLILPCCYNAAIDTAPRWLPLLQKTPHPLHGILGFSDHYAGDDIGALIMAEFGRLLRDNRRTIFEAWRRANDSLKQPWGAVIHEESKANDTLAKWITPSGLSTPSQLNKVRQFDPQNILRGGDKVAQETALPSFDAIFHMASGQPITADNNENLNIGLIPGQRGHLLLRANDPNRPFQPGQKMGVLFIYFRPTKGHMDLNKLLRFDPKLDPVTGLNKIQLKIDANTEKKPSRTGLVDAIEYTFTAGESREARLDFQVLDRKTAFEFYEEDPDGEGNHGAFWVRIFPPGVPLGSRSGFIGRYLQNARLRNGAGPK